MIELGVNIDHVATIRQARRTYEPDPVWAAVEAHLGGADGITVHLREDRRHIQDEDVRRLRELTHIKLNLEMAATDEMVAHRLRHPAGDGDARPRGPPGSHHRGWSRHRRAGARLKDVVARLAAAGIVVSVFIDADAVRSRRRTASAPRCARCTPGPTHTHSTRAAAMPRVPPSSRSSPSRARRAPRSARTACVSMPGMRSTTSTSSRSPSSLACASYTSGTRIVSRAVFVGMREAVREMKTLIVNAAMRAAIGAHG